MVQAVNRDGYTHQLHGLLPRGRAWPRESGTVLNSFVEAIAAQMSEIDLAASGLLDEILPNSTFDLLPDWERVAGLPDVCSVLGATITVRRASLLEKLVSKPTLNPSEFVRIGRSFGVEIEVDEHDQTRAAASSMLDTTGGKWRHVWWITIPTSADVVRFNMLSDFDTPFLSIGRNTEMECRLQNASPAHTELHIEYNSVPMLPALPDREAAQGSSTDFVLPQATGGDAPVTYGVTGLPAGVTFAAATRTLTVGTAAVAGVTTLTYTATDDDGDADSQTFQLTVAGAQTVQFRFDSIADLQTFASGVALGSADGRWEEQASGSTDSGNTGPANNSGGPYVATDASGGSFAEIRDNSELELSVVDQWLEATGRVLRLRLVLAGAWSLAGNGLQVQGREGGGSWEDIQLIRGWSYDSTVDAGDTFNDDDGTQRTAVLDGGWVDYDIAIADRFDDVRMRLVATGGSTTQKDLALWSAELRNS